jgi:hypothetical protein
VLTAIVLRPGVIELSPEASGVAVH